MEENTMNTEVNVEESAVTTSKLDLSNIVGAGAVAVASVGLFELGKLGLKKGKKAIVKLAGKIDSERNAKDAETIKTADEETTSEE